MQKTREAINALRQTIRIRPNHAEYHSLLGLTYLSDGNRRAALAEYEILKDLDRELADRLFDLIYPP